MADHVRVNIMSERRPCPACETGTVFCDDEALVGWPFRQSSKPTVTEYKHDQQFSQSHCSLPTELKAVRPRSEKRSRSFEVVALDGTLVVLLAQSLVQINRVKGPKQRDPLSI